MAGVDLAGCPDCGAPAEVVERFDLMSTSGPVEHVKVQCARRHWFVQIAETVPGTVKERTPANTPVR